MFIESKMNIFTSFLVNTPIHNAHCLDNQADLLEIQSIDADLSDYKLSEEHYKLLIHGISFCPTKKHVNGIKLCYDTEFFYETFDYTNVFHRVPTTTLLPKITNKSWTPSDGRNEYVDSFVNNVRNHFICVHILNICIHIVLNAYIYVNILYIFMYINELKTHIYMYIYIQS